MSIKLAVMAAVLLAAGCTRADSPTPTPTPTPTPAMAAPKPPPPPDAPPALPHDGRGYARPLPPDPGTPLHGAMLTTLSALGSRDGVAGTVGSYEVVDFDAKTLETSDSFEYGPREHVKRRALTAKLAAEMAAAADAIWLEHAPADPLVHDVSRGMILLDGDRALSVSGGESYHRLMALITETPRDPAP
jgi:hypothetical protein